MRYGKISAALAIAVVMLPLFQRDAQATNPKLRLQEKKVQVSLLLDKLKENQERALGLCRELNNRMAELEREIADEREKFHINSYQQAVENPRIQYDMKLIRKILAYLSALEEKIEYLKTGVYELDYCYNQAEDDLKILDTLGGLNIEGLVDVTDKLFAKYGSEGDRLIIKCSDIDLISPEKVWQRLAVEE